MSAIKKESNKNKGMSLNMRNTLVGMTFILPNFIGFCLFTLVPVIFSFILSLMKWDGFNEMKFVGFKNFVKIFKDSKFIESIILTFEYSFFTVVLTMILSLALAILLNNKLKFVNFFRSAIFFPHVASIVAIGCVWSAMFMKNGGVVNAALGLVMKAENLPGWLADVNWALPAVIIVSIWRSMGYFMIIYLAALQDIPYSLYEAAEIDGASKWQQFRRITFPMLTPSHFFVLMMLIVNSFKTFDLIFMLTEGGPGTATTLLSMYIYNKSFISWDFGVASAAAMILFLIVGGITLLQFRLEKKFNDFM